MYAFCQTGITSISRHKSQLKKMVAVFKTNVLEVNESKAIIQKLLAHLPDSRINFDLEDCDKILRVEHNIILNNEIILLVNTAGYKCEVLI